MSVTTPETRPAETDAERKAPRRLGDRIFSGGATGAGSLILLLLAAVAAFLIWKAWYAITAPSAELIQEFGQLSSVDGNIWRYVGPLALGTVIAAVLALAIATPVSIGIALFISHYAPRRLAQVLGYLVDLLAAIPSVVYGLWGALYLLPKLHPIFDWLSNNLGFIPLFDGPAANPPKVMLAAGILLAVMILPIITAVCREVFLQTPRLHEEAALALGATRWEMIRMTVLPFGRSGMISAAMLGLGRALGETMAVVMVISPLLRASADKYSFDLLKAESQETIAANIARQFPEANPNGVSVLIFTGLVLFVITLAVNMFARWVVSRRRDFSGAN